MVAPEKSFLRPSAGGIEGRHQPLYDTSFPTLPAPPQAAFPPQAHQLRHSEYTRKHVFKSIHIYNNVNFLSSHLRGPHGTDHPGHESSCGGKDRSVRFTACSAGLDARKATVGHRTVAWHHTQWGYFTGLQASPRESSGSDPYGLKLDLPVGKALVVCSAVPRMEVPLPHRIPGLLWLPAQINIHLLGWRTQGGTNKKPETSQARQLTPVIPALSLHYRTRPYPKMKIRNWISFVGGQARRSWGSRRTWAKVGEVGRETAWLPKDEGN